MKLFAPKLNKEHGSARTRKKRVKLPWGAYLFYLALITASVTGVSFARYTSTLGGTGTAVVANPVFTSSFTTTSTTVAAPATGDGTTYGFSVSNIENSVRSDVTVKYTITVTATGNLPLTYTLTEKDGTAVSGTATATAAGDGTAATFTTGNITMSNSNDVKHEYVLTVTWAGDKNHTYSTEIDAVTISVNWVQANG